MLIRQIDLKSKQINNKKIHLHTRFQFWLPIFVGHFCPFLFYLRSSLGKYAHQKIAQYVFISVNKLLRYQITNSPKEKRGLYVCFLSNDLDNHIYSFLQQWASILSVIWCKWPRGAQSICPVSTLETRTRRKLIGSKIKDKMWEIQRPELKAEQPSERTA